MESDDDHKSGSSGTCSSSPTTPSTNEDRPKKTIKVTGANDVICDDIMNSKEGKTVKNVTYLDVATACFSHYLSC